MNKKFRNAVGEKGLALPHHTTCRRVEAGTQSGLTEDQAASRCLWLLFKQKQKSFLLNGLVCLQEDGGGPVRGSDVINI